MATKLINVLPREELNFTEKANTDIYKHYIYGYYVNGVIKYIGRGSDAHIKGKKQYSRVRDFKQHVHCLKDIPIDEEFDVVVMNYFEKLEDTVMAEAGYIKAFHLVENGWNNREELEDPKFYDILDTIIGNNQRDLDVKTLVHLLMKNATGAKGTESEALASDILSNINIEDQNICVISNEQFGGFNIIKDLVTNHENKYASLSTICSEEMLMKIGADDIMDKSFLNVNTGIESFLTMDFKGKKFDIIIMNPPWVDLGIQFIEKAVSLLKPGGKLVTIMGLNQFSPMLYKDAHINGTFRWLNNKGYFQRIETARHDGAWGTRKFFPTGNGAACWFIWENISNRGLPTQMVNELGEEFIFNLTGAEWMVPEEPFEDIQDIVDWSKNGLIFGNQCTESPKKIKEKAEKGIPPDQADPKTVRFKFGTVKGYEDFTGTTDLKNCIILPSDLTSDNVDLNKVKDFFTKDMKRKLALYARHITAYTRHYPIKKSLVRK